MPCNWTLNLRDKNNWISFFKSSYLLFIFLFIYFPWFFLVLLSFQEPSEKGNLGTNFKFDFNYGENYKNFFFSKEFTNDFWGGFLNSLIIAFFVIPISLLIGLITVIALWNNNYKNKKTIFLFSNIAIGSPDIIQGMAFLSLFTVCFLPLGIFKLGFVSIILSHVSFCIPYVIIFLYPKIKKINKSILFASYDLKYTFTQTIKKIIIPLLMPNIIAASMLVFAISFDDFIITNLVKGNVETITSKLYLMKKGVKAWAITFGALLFWFSLFLTIIKLLFVNLNKKSNQNV